jgi:hypothetical protein
VVVCAKAGRAAVSATAEAIVSVVSFIRVFLQAAPQRR